MASSLFRLVVFLGFLAAPSGLVHSQRPAPVDPASPPILRRTAAERYAPVFEELRRIEPRSDRAAQVRNVLVRRDAIEFHLDQGELYPLTPVAGRTVGAVFRGIGSVSFVPPLPIERARLKRVFGDSTLDVPTTAIVFFVADSTLAQLEAQLSFAGGSHAREAAGPAGDALDQLIDGRAESVHPTFMAALLNGELNGFFYAYIKREHGEDLIFEVDPQAGEEILLLRGGRLPGQKLQTVCQFPRAAELADSARVTDAERDPLELKAYRIEATIAKNFGFSATATIRFAARRDGVRWARFLLYKGLDVDSVVSGSGASDTFFRHERSGAVWIRFPTALRGGEPDSIRVVYHGNLISFGSLIDPFGGAPHRRLPTVLDKWLFIKDPSTWFPRLGSPTYGSLQATDMDLTFHTPRRYQFVSIGRLVESQVEGNVLTTHWVSERPTTVASFNIGEFEEFQITDPRIPPVTVQVNNEGHRAFRSLGALGGWNPQEDVGPDVANSLAFFSHVYGAPLFHHYYATEIPYSYGEAFPGLIYLSVWTFQTINESGVEETFRAHEMAHQWWGIGVDPATYRDAWLSEGFADFSGLWYTQIILGDNDKYFKLLDDWRREIRRRRSDAPPINLGTRASEFDRRDYELVVYRKGAWVLQMLRNMMLDLRTLKEDAFIAMMRDFYQKYRGRRASTRDFQRVVERHLDLPMDWFFDEWVGGTAIPTYILSWHAEPTADHHYLLRLRIRQEDVPSEFVMPVPLNIELAGGGQARVRVTVRGPVTETQLQLPVEPTKLELNSLGSVLADVKTEGWQ